MRELQEKRRIKRLVYSRAMYIFLLVLILFVFQATWGVFKKYQETKENLEYIQEELTGLKKMEGEVKNRIGKLKTKDGIEREFREKFGLAKEGEGVIIVVESPQSKQKLFVPKSTIWGNVFGSFIDIFD